MLVPGRGIFPYLVMAGGVLMAASAAILIRFAQGLGLPSVTIAAGRMMVAAAILLPLVLLRAGPDLRALRRRDVALGIAAGGFLAGHFAAWISSLAYTSVASSAALVSTNPLWVAIASLLLFRERLSAATGAGIAVTMAGALLIAVSDGGGAGGANALLGNGLALLGALCGSGYFLIGRELRRSMSVLAYIWLAYTGAAIALVALALALGPGDLAVLGRGAEAMGLVVPGWALIVALAVGPQLLGHTAFNWSLRYLSATFVTIALLGEPIGSALLALVFFGEWFQPPQLAGFVLLLIGISIAARGEGGGTPIRREGSGAASHAS